VYQEEKAKLKKKEPLETNNEGERKDPYREKTRRTRLTNPGLKMLRTQRIPTKAHNSQ